MLKDTTSFGDKGGIDMVIQTADGKCESGQVGSIRPHGRVGVVVYLEWVELFFKANMVDDSKVFLTVTGASNYALLQNLLALEKAAYKFLDVLTEVLRNQYELMNSPVAERFRFVEDSRQPRNQWRSTVWTVSWRALARSVVRQICLWV